MSGQRVTPVGEVLSRYSPLRKRGPMKLRVSHQLHLAPWAGRVLHGGLGVGIRRESGTRAARHSRRWDVGFTFRALEVHAERVA